LIKINCFIHLLPTAGIEKSDDMEGLENALAMSSQAGNPRQWLAAYLGARGQLASYASDFRCDPACARPGCKDQDLQVPVSLVDLTGAAGHRDEAVSASFHRHYTLGLVSNLRQDCLSLISLRLKKPCPLLEDELCSIYPVRPLPCALFPEYLVYEGTFEANAPKERFRDYLCFHRPVVLSPQRAAAVAKLKHMWERESLISSYYLFNQGHCHFDFGNLIKDFLDETGSLAEAESKERPEGRPLIPHQAIEGFFLEQAAKHQPFAGVSEKISHLDSPEGQLQFLQFLHDDLLIKRLIEAGDDRALIFRFVKGKLQVKRRSLIPAEYKFY
jgi:Fe-S-cluster containining protein